MSVWLPSGGELSTEVMHERLVGLVQGRSRARIQLGRLVEEFARRGGHHELGFSSVGAWALRTLVEVILPPGTVLHHDGCVAHRSRIPIRSLFAPCSRGAARHQEMAS